MALLEPVLARLSRYCHALTKDAEEGRDLLSDAILITYEHFAELRETEAFASYLFTTARRIYYRQSKRKRWWGVFGKDLEEISNDSHRSMETRADLTALDEALATLPEKQREAVILFEISDLSLEEIRKIQGGSLSGVKSRVTRGRERLYQLLGEPPQRSSTLPPLSATVTTKHERVQLGTLIREKL